MSVWYCIPSKRPPEEAEPVLQQWRERGYRIALCVDTAEEAKAKDSLADAIISSPDGYRGYARSANALIALVIEREPEAEWFVCGGDDVLPDPNHTAEEIARECTDYFLNHNSYVDNGNGNPQLVMKVRLGTFGVMQPTGDRWGIVDGTHAYVPTTPGCDSCACKQCGRREDSPNHLCGAYIDRVAGSPWIGREFARRMYQGRGPYWPEYTHMGVDEELQAVAIKYGIFWQRPDLTHYHQHWGRPREGELYGDAARMPAFLEKANSAPEWARYKRIYGGRKAMEFPGSEPL